MKKYLWILLLLPSLCWSATGDLQTIGGKVDTAITSIAGKAGTAIATICGKNYTDGDAGCTPSASGTVLWGTTTAGTGEGYTTADYGNYFNVDTAATWAGDCTTETVHTLEVYFRGHEDGNCKAYMTASDGTVLANGISNALTGLSYEETPSLHTFTMGTDPTLTKGTNYKMSIVCSMSVDIFYTDTGTAAFCFQSTGTSYTSPGNLTCSSYHDESATFGGFRAKK